MTQAGAEAAMPEGDVPLAVKLAYSAFMAVLVPVYWYHYGPTNFLYFCDVALLLTLYGIWAGQPLPVSMSAVGIVIPQLVWVLDFLGTMIGAPLIGMTAYMFNEKAPLYLRGLSLFHGWLPFLVLYLVWRMGYDRRAFAAWTVLATVVLLVCFFLMPGHDPNRGLTPVNINYVWGPDDSAPQTWVHPYVWLGGLIAGMPVLVYWPVHALLSRFAPRSVRA